MSSHSPRVAILGECMLELSPADQGSSHYALSVAGDTYNSAVGMAQLGLPVAYVSAVGVDTYSQKIVQHASDHGIDTQYLELDLQARAGLYLIDNDERGERFLTYWRDQSAAKQLFSNKQRLGQVLDKLLHIPYLYLSGITLALCSVQSRERLHAWCLGYRAQGGTVVYDCNYRAALWPSLTEAREAHWKFLEITDIFLPSAEDTYFLCEPESELALTFKEKVLKNGAAKIRVTAADNNFEYAPPPIAKMLDSSGAGDAFNAGYLAARLLDHDLQTSVQFAARVAAQTIQHRGAIVAPQIWRELKAELTALTATA